MSKHRFNLILPGELWQRIKALASRNRRAVTQEIIIAIEDHVEAVAPISRSESKEAEPRPEEQR